MICVFITTPFFVGHILTHSPSDSRYNNTVMQFEVSVDFRFYTFPLISLKQCFCPQLASRLSSAANPWYLHSLYLYIKLVINAYLSFFISSTILMHLAKKMYPFPSQFRPRKSWPELTHLTCTKCLTFGGTYHHMKNYQYTYLPRVHFIGIVKSSNCRGVLWVPRKQPQILWIQIGHQNLILPFIHYPYHYWLKFMTQCNVISWFTRPKTGVQWCLKSS